MAKVSRGEVKLTVTLKVVPGSTIPGRARRGLAVGWAEAKYSGLTARAVKDNRAINLTTNRISFPYI